MVWSGTKIKLHKGLAIVIQNDRLTAECYEDEIFRLDVVFKAAPTC